MPRGILHNLPTQHLFCGKILRMRITTAGHRVFRLIAPGCWACRHGEPKNAKIWEYLQKYALIENPKKYRSRLAIFCLVVFCTKYFCIKQLVMIRANNWKNLCGKVFINEVTLWPAAEHLKLILNARHFKNLHFGTRHINAKCQEL